VPATEVYYEVAKKALDAQMQEIDQLDVKASTAYAAASGVLAAFAALVALAALPMSGLARIAVIACFGAAAVVYAFVLVNLVRAYKVGKWAHGPTPSRVRDRSANHDADIVQDWIARVCTDSIERNKPAIDTKSDRLNRGLLGLAIESGLLVAAVLITLVLR
jgi:hypothetical protein